MQTQSDEREDITKLFHDAFVRVCQLAIADCGISVVDLTLHLSIELNTGVPQVLGTIVAETVRPPLAKDGCSAIGSAALNKASSFDENDASSCSRGEKDSYANDHRCDSLVHRNSVETANFNGTVAVGSSPPTCTKENAFKAVKDTPLTTCALTTNSIDNLILSDNDHVTVPLEELLSDVVKSNECLNTACIARESALSGNGGTEIEDDCLSISQHDLLYGKISDRPSVDGDTSFEEELIVDESYSSSNTSANHTESLHPDLRSSFNSHPVSGEAAAYVNDISLLKLYPADCLLPKCCPDISNPSYSQQPKIPTISPNSYRLVQTNASNAATVPWEAEFQKILSTMATNVSVTADAGQGKCFHSRIHIHANGRID